ncbi:MAG: hypothetical protein K2N58_09415 [Treponemataceae bacterium]|nr:hypothetical protein [Treponemataceae bacterium]
MNQLDFAVNGEKGIAIACVSGNNRHSMLFYQNICQIAYSPFRTRMTGNVIN